MHNKSKLTIILLTRDRQDYVLRSMRYWSGLPFELHVLDGSMDPIAASSMRGFGAHVHYHHKPVGYIERLVLSMDFVETPFSVFIPDDEFFLKNGLDAAVSELISNDELVACGGQTIGFWCSKSGCVLANKEYPKHKGYELLSDSAEERVMQLFSDYTPAVYYSVLRTDFLKLALKVIGEKEFSGFAVFELQLHMLAAWAGKIKLLDNIYWLRSSENSPIRNTDKSMCPDNKVNDWWRSEAMQDEVAEFVSVMSQHLGRNGSFQRDAKRVVRDAMEAYVRFLDEYYSSGPRGFLFPVSRALYKIKFKLGLVKEPERGVPLMNILSQFDDGVAHSAKMDLSEIKSILDSWYADRDQ